MAEQQKVERETMQLLSKLLPVLDPLRLGLCIEAGAGSMDWYCELFRDEGYKTICIEPIATPELKMFCYLKSIPLLQAALCDKPGVTTLYFGKYGTDYNGIEQGSWGTKETESMEVEALTLEYLIPSTTSYTPTCLKLDIEGAEYRVLPQLTGIAKKPACVVFEYGGGDMKSTNMAAWDADGRDRLQTCLKALQDTDYTQTLLIDAKQETAAINLQTVTIDDAFIDTVFTDDASYGNAIAVHGEIDFKIMELYEQI